MNVNELGISLDYNRLYSTLSSLLVSALEEAVSDTVRYIKQTAKLGKFEKETEFTQQLISIGEDEIIYEIGVDHWYALISNYGSGSSMDKGVKNPYFEEYIESDIFNKKRISYGYAVLGRGVGKMYYRFSEGKEVEGKMPENVNLETTRNEKTGMMYYTPQKPLYWFENALKHFETMLPQFIEKWLSGIDLNDFLIEGGVR